MAREVGVAVEMAPMALPKLDRSGADRAPFSVLEERKGVVVVKRSLLL
jgi:hypothetical protein